MTNPPLARRLNPFLFPADTDFRFLLLIAAVLGASLFVYRSLVNAMLRTEFGQVAMNCLTTSIADAEACWDPFERKQGLLIAAGVLAVILVAYLIYRLTPWWKIRQGRLILLTADDAPEMLLYLDTLCQQMELRHVPRFLIEPVNRTVGGLAFGCRGRYCVVLTGGLVTCYVTDRAAFRAVVLHELAHLKNGDVDKTYFTMAIWYAFLLIALLPFATSLVVEVARFGAGEMALAAQVGWRAALLAVLVYTIRNSVLRVREFYADVRAATSAGTIAPLTRVLAAMPLPASRWQPFGPVHPQPAQRQQVLADPVPLFRVEFMEALSAGLAIAVAVHNTIFWLTLFLPGHREDAAYLLALVLFAPLVVGVVGLGVWRAAFAARTVGTGPLHLGRVSLGLGVGLAAGRILSFDAAVEAIGRNEQWLAALASDVAWGVLLLAMLYFFLQWVNIGASVWLATVTSSHTLRRLYTISFVVYALLLAWWLSGFLLATEISHMLSTEDLIAILFVWQRFFARYIVGWPIGMAALITLVAFPLIGWLVRKRLFAFPDTQWAFLDPVPVEELALTTEGE